MANICSLLELISVLDLVWHQSKGRLVPISIIKSACLQDIHTDKSAREYYRLLNTIIM